MSVNFEEKTSTSGKKFMKPTEEIFTIPPGVFEVVDTNENLKTISPSILSVVTTTEDITLKGNLTIHTTRNKELKIVENQFYYDIGIHGGVYVGGAY